MDIYFNTEEGKPVILNILKHLFSSGEDVNDRVYITSKEIDYDKFSSYFEKSLEMRRIDYLKHGVLYRSKETKWVRRSGGSWIYEEEGDSESINNRVEEAAYAGEPALIYHFESRNDPPIQGIRHLSRKYPELLFKLYSEDEAPCFGFALFKNGVRFVFFLEMEEFEITRAAEWPILAALLLENYPDEKLHLFLKEAAEKLPDDENFENELEEARQEERRKIEETIAFYREKLKEREER